MIGIEEHDAKNELLRIDGFLEDQVLLIGGLAVQRYHHGRVSKDLDIVCTLEQQKMLTNRAYPSELYEVEQTQDDMRPNQVVRNLKTGARIYLGAKIIERTPYQYIDYDQFLEDAVPYEYGGVVATNILLPAAHVLAFSKICSFIARRDSEKSLQDLTDFADLTNNKLFSLNRFIAFVERADAGDFLFEFFSRTVLTENESEVLRKSSPVRFQGIFPIALISSAKQSIEAGRHAQQLISKIDELSNSPVATELGRIFDVVHELQFSKDVIRRNWDISFEYDCSSMSDGKIVETINWEYELFNIRSHVVEYDVTLTHSADKLDGLLTKIYTVRSDGTREEVKFSETVSADGNHYKREKATIKIEPGVPYFVTLYYSNTWYVNSNKPFILNATTTKEPCLNCRMRFTVPQGMQVSLLNRDIIEPHLIGNIYDVRLARPLLAEQKIEYVLEKIE